MKRLRRRIAYLVALIVVVALGLGSRRYGDSLPTFLAKYAGDTLWALMVFLGISMCAPMLSLWRRVGLALMGSYAVEFSQLYQAPWINGIRHTTLGGLVLGFGFLWSDLLCYTIGITLGAIVECMVDRCSIREAVDS